MKIKGLCLFFVFFLLINNGARAQKITQQKTTSWNGFEKVDFLLDGIPAYYVKPHKALAGNPWVWRAHFPGWHTVMDSILLQRGFFIAYINTNDQYGAPAAMMAWDNFYNYLTEKLSFSPKAALEGVSRGGLYIYGWAKRNPDKVSCIYAEAPVCDFKSWPGGKGKGEGDKAAWEQLKQVYGFTEQQAINYDDNPIDNLDGLAAFKVPILHMISLKDKIVPADENTFVLIQRYIKLGGPATVYSMSGSKQELQGHHFEIEHPDWWADFITTHSYPVKKLLPYQNYFQTRNGISNFYKNIKDHQPVTVAFLGGSITYNPGWRNMVSKYLQERFPAAKFHFISAGIPSLGSLPHVFRLQHDILDSGKVDLMFVEAAVNDNVNGTDSLTQVRDLEGIIRHARMNNPKMDLVLSSFADPDKLNDYKSGKTPVSVWNHELVAGHYNLPSINLAKEVYDKIKAGEFSWEYDFKDLHPSIFGQEIYFETMKAMLNNCFALADTSLIKSKAARMPAMLDQHSFTNGNYLSITKAQLGEGWNLVKDWHPADNAGTRDGFVHVPVLETVKPGAELSLSFSGTAIGMAIISGPDAGTIEFSIDGSAFKPMNIHTQWSDQLHLPWYVLFSGTLKNKNHILHLRMAPSANSNNKSTACRIVYFLVN